MGWLADWGTLSFGEVSTLYLPALVTVLVYALNARSGIAVGNARRKHNVNPPTATGPPEFQRAFQAHNNNAEQYPLFLALMWVTAVLVNGVFAGAVGLFWVAMRHLYVSRYHQTGEGLGMYTIPAYHCLSAMSLAILLKIALSFAKDFGLI